VECPFGTRVCGPYLRSAGPGEVVLAEIGRGGRSGRARGQAGTPSHAVERPGRVPIRPRRERRSEPMIKIWSELPVSRTREQLADLATLLWVVFWGNLVWQLFQFLIGFTAAGRAVHAGGENMIAGGRSVGDSLARAALGVR